MRTFAISEVKCFERRKKEKSKSMSSTEAEGVQMMRCTRPFVNPTSSRTVRQMGGALVLSWPSSLVRDERRVI